MAQARFRTHSKLVQSEKWFAQSSNLQRRRKTVPEAWIEIAVSNEWMAAYRLLPGPHGEPVVSELRIFPLEAVTGRPPGRWTGTALGLDARFPPGGISAEVVRQVRVAEHWRIGPEFARWMSSISRGLAMQPVQSFQRTSDSTRLGKKRGRPPIRSDQFFAVLAKEYAERIAKGSRTPTADIARRRRFPQSRVRDLLNEARRRGLLSTPGQGKFGGTLSPRALALLRESK
jgi:hypothetical protein